MTPRERFLAACRREEVDHTPVWFMRQAGRYLPGYREVRKSYGVVEICKAPEVCKEITVMPVKELGVDAAVLFADIMLPLEGMGIQFQIEENLGPVISKPVTSLSGAESLQRFDSKEHTPYVLEAIRLVKSKLAETNTALVGFSGAPFTIASYIIEGQPSREFSKTKKMMFDDKDTWRLLMAKLTEMVIDYLSSQIEAGVDAVQLFDSWVGTLSADDYSVLVAPYVRKIFMHLKKHYPDVPTIHFGTNTSHLLGVMKEEAGGDVFSIDWRTSITAARKTLGKKSAIQGNLEPAVLLSSDRRFIGKRIGMVLEDNNGEKGHVFNLGHGMLRNTPVENVRFVVEYVHKKT